jgi:hypothetical protein
VHPLKTALPIAVNVLITEEIIERKKRSYLCCFETYVGMNTEIRAVLPKKALSAINFKPLE